MNKIQKQIANVFTKSYGISAFATVTEDGKPWVRYVRAIPIIWRLESSDGKTHHSPTLATLQRYAKALYQKIVIRLVSER